MQKDGAAGGGVEEVVHLETRRILGNDWVVRHDNHYFQVQAQSRNYAPAKSKETVCEWEDGRLQIRYRDLEVRRDQIPGPVPARTPREAKAQKTKKRGHFYCRKEGDISNGA